MIFVRLEQLQIFLNLAQSDRFLKDLFLRYLMVRRKQVRTRGKLQLSRFFQELKAGDSVSVVKERSINSNFPTRLQGRTGVVAGKRGKAVIVKIKDVDKEKKFLIEPIHLKKIKQ